MPAHARKTPLAWWWWASALCGLAVQTWFRPGRYWAAGDTGPFVRTSFGDAAWLWNHQTTGAGSTSYGIAGAVVADWIRLVGAFGGSSPLAQRLFYTVVVFLALAAVGWCAATIVRSQLAACAAVITAFSSPFWIARLPNLLIIVALGYSALVTGTLWRVAQGERRSVLGFTLLSVGLSYLALNTPLLIVTLGFGVVILVTASVVGGEGGARRAGHFVLRAAPLVLLINLWWVVPLAMTLGVPAGFVVTAQLDPFRWSWTSVNNGLGRIVTMTADWAWTNPEYVPVARSLGSFPFNIAAWIAPTLAVASLLVARGVRRRTSILLVSVGAVLVVLSQGLHAPFAGLNRLFFTYVPGSYLLREPFSKLGPTLVLIVALLVAILFDEWLSRRPRSSSTTQVLKVGSVLALVLAIVVAGYPMWNGTLVPTTRPILPSARVAVPHFWTGAAATINSSKLPGKLLTLPLNPFYQQPTTWGYYGVDVAPLLISRPVIQQYPGGYYSATPGFQSLLDEVQVAIIQHDDDAALHLLTALGASMILVRGDLAPHLVDGNEPVDPHVVTAGLDHLPGVERVARFGPMTLFRLSHPSTGASVATRTIQALGSPSAAALSVASAPSSVTVLTGTAAHSTSAIATSLGIARSLQQPGAGQSLTLDTGSHVIEARTQSTSTVQVGLDARGALEVRPAWWLGPAGATTPALATLQPTSTATAVAVGDHMAPLGSVGSGGPTLPVTAGQPIVGLGPSTTTSIASSPLLASCSFGTCTTATLPSAAAGTLVEVDLSAPGSLCAINTVTHHCVTPLTESTPGVRGPAVIMRLPAHVESIGIASTVPGPIDVHPLVPVVTGSLATTGPTTVQSTGPTTLTTHGPQGAASSLLQPWGTVGDCNNSSHLPRSQTRLSAHVNGTQVTLSAHHHAACVSAVVTDTSLSSVIELSLNVRRLSGDQPARICLWNFSTRACQRLIPASDTPGSLDTGYITTKSATTLHFLVPAHRYWLFVYADGAPDGSTAQIETVRYDNVRVVPVSPWSFASLPSAALSADTAGVATAHWANPASATVSVTRPARSQLVGIFESAAPGWQISAGATTNVPITLDGYRQGWLLTAQRAKGGTQVSTSFAVSYRPAMIARAAIVVSVVTFGLTVVGAIVSRRRRRARSSLGDVSVGASKG